jgi:spore coat protein U-like protein
VNRLLLLVLLALVPLGASAATTCRIVNAGSLAFGNYDYFSLTPNDSLATMTITCTRIGGPQRLSLLVRLNQGMNGTSASSRRMMHTAGRGDTLAYNLYRDPGRSGVWGNADGVNTMPAEVAIPNNGSASATLTIYGRIPIQQDASPGLYSDSVQVTVDY